MEQLAAAKALNKAIKFEDSAYRGLLHKAQRPKNTVQKVRAIDRLRTKHGFTEAMLRKHNIKQLDPITDIAIFNAALDVQRMYHFSLESWAYVGIYMTQAHLDFRNAYLERHR